MMYFDISSTVEREETRVLHAGIAFTKIIVHIKHGVTSSIVAKPLSVKPINENYINLYALLPYVSHSFRL